jgi:hypothetical protein
MAQFRTTKKTKHEFQLKNTRSHSNNKKQELPLKHKNPFNEKNPNAKHNNPFKTTVNPTEQHNNPFNNTNSNRNHDNPFKQKP